MFKPRWFVLMALIVFATVVKLFPYLWMQFNITVDPRYSYFLPWNFAPLMAIVLFAGAHFRSPVWAFAIPLLVHSLSDLGIYLITGRPEWAMYPYQPVVYGMMLLCGLMSLSLRKREQTFPSALPVLGVGFVAETLFFLVTNAAVWRCSAVYPTAGSPIFDQSFAGLMQVYALGLPFYLRSLVSTGLYAGLLFYGLRIPVEKAIREQRAEVELVST